MPRVSRGEFVLREELNRRGIWYRHQYRVEFPSTYRLGARSLDLVLKSRGRWIALDFDTEDDSPKLRKALRALGYRFVRVKESDFAHDPKKTAATLIRSLNPDTIVKRNAEARKLIRAAIGKHLPEVARKVSARRKGAA